jgi:aryl-alcohol dehydrogenase-like predicted oxidoreductase
MRFTPPEIFNIPVSVLGFGCSGVLGRAGRKQSLSALHAAFDSGINFFDTARAYGYGESEALLGEFLAGRRHQVVLSTKFGILPVRANWLKNSIKPLARKVFQFAPSVRRAMVGQIAAQVQPNQFSVEILRSSFEQSLHKLNTDYVDLLFMHNATVTAMQQDDLLAELEKLLRSGKARRVGIAADMVVVEHAITSANPALTAYQSASNLLDQRLIAAAQSAPGIFIANQPFGGKPNLELIRQRLTSLAADAATPHTLREKLGVVDNTTLADIALNSILISTGIHVVVPSMLQPRHVKTNVAAIEHSRFTPDELPWLRQQF